MTEILSLIVETLEAIQKNYNQEATLNIIKLKALIQDLDRNLKTLLPTDNNVE